MRWDGAADGLVHQLAPLLVGFRARIVAGQGVAAFDVAGPEADERVFRVGPALATRRSGGRGWMGWRSLVVTRPDMNT